MENKPILKGLWRDQKDTPEGKYLVLRRDGSTVEWPHFVLGARDPASPAALRAYAKKAKKLKMNSGYTDAVKNLADEFEIYRSINGTGDPEAGRHRADDPATINKMKLAKAV